MLFQIFFQPPAADLSLSKVPERVYQDRSTKEWVAMMVKFYKETNPVEVKDFVNALESAGAEKKGIKLFLKDDKAGKLRLTRSDAPAWEHTYGYSMGDLKTIKDVTAKLKEFSK